MKAKVYLTDAQKNRLTLKGEFEMKFANTDIQTEVSHKDDVEAFLINIHPEVEFGEVSGIGGSINDTTACVWDSMPEDKKQEFVKAYFDKEEGIGYNFTRLCIGSCDFSSEDYTCIEENDYELATFNLSHDEKAVIPLVYAAKEHSDLKIFASPWSPPAFMKTNGNRIGGKLRLDCYELWAKHFRKYIDVCKEKGIDIWAVTVQNEPRHTQLWESCLYTPEEEADFIGYLGRALEGTDVKILCYDHCRERVFERAQKMFADKNGHYCDGIAHHWYSGDHFGELKAFSQKYPDKLSIASEGCFGVPKIGLNDDVELSHAESYAHDVCGCFNNGLTHYCDWSLALNEENGPYHNREGRGCYADANVFYDRTKNEIIYRLGYYYMGHYSKFTERGSKVISASSYCKDLETIAFKNPDSTVSCVVLNQSDKAYTAIIRLDEHNLKLQIEPHSIITAVIE